MVPIIFQMYVWCGTCAIPIYQVLLCLVILWFYEEERIRTDTSIYEHCYNVHGHKQALLNLLYF